MNRLIAVTVPALVTLLALLQPRPAPAAAVSGPLSLSPVPLIAATAARPNVLLIFANSNSMDEDPTGLAVGSANAASKSEIARAVGKNLVTKYTGAINMGLMAFQQSTGGANPVSLMQLHSSPYDVSYNPANYNPAFTGLRNSTTKRFREPNPTNPGAFIYYNVNLPFYSSSNQGTAFCYSSTATTASNPGHPDGFNNGEVVPGPGGGPWDSYYCFNQKTSTSDALPAPFGNAASESAAGYSGRFGPYSFYPTDSDLGQGITDFGRFLSWKWVSPTWFSNGSPGKGYMHIPVANLDATQAAKFNTKLGTSQFAVNGPTNAALPLQNAGLTPLEGSLITARTYFQGSLTDAAQGGPLGAPPTSCGRDFVVLLTNGLPSVKANGTASSNVAQMLTEATAAATALRTIAGVETYVVGFALPYGVNPAQLDSIASAGGTGTAFNATDAATLSGALDDVFADILQKSGAASAVAVNSGSAGANGFVYQAKYDLGWTGQLNAYAVQTDGTLAASPTWQAGAQLNALNWDTGRTVITYKPSTGNGIRFRWPVNAAAPTSTELDAAQIAALNADASGTADGRGSGRLNYLRGNRAQEGSNTATQFRQRNGVLGDLVNSSPIYVGEPKDSPPDASYAAFRSAYQARTRMVYVGGNDGFLHGFRASDGVELLAYMPSAVFANISKLTAQSYTHRYYVDASPGVGDVKIAGNWRTLLAGGLGAGGRGVYALDVTDPSIFQENQANTVSLWEFNSSNDADLGYVFDTPTMVRLNTGQYGVLFGNGYNNTGSGESAIFILNAADGSVIRKIRTGVGSVATPNGIGNARAIDTDGNGTVDIVYGGDLRGNMWKFDLSDANAGNWAVAFNGAPLVTVQISSDDQPITAAPDVTPHPLGGYMVVFGTGRYIATGDQLVTDTQSLYGVRDDGGHSSRNRGHLEPQTITGTTTIAGKNYRLVSQNPINWTSRDGWRLDLPAAGERVVVEPVLRFGRVVFTTLIPDNSPCSAGGYSWLMEIDYLTGGQSAQRTLDTNGDNQVTAADALVGGLQLASIASSATVRGRDDANENKFLNAADGNILRVLEASGGLTNRRLSWRQER